MPYFWGLHRRLIGWMVDKYALHHIKILINTRKYLLFFLLLFSEIYHCSNSTLINSIQICEQVFSLDNQFTTFALWKKKRSNYRQHGNEFRWFQDSWSYCFIPLRFGTQLCSAYFLLKHVGYSPAADRQIHKKSSHLETCVNFYLPSCIIPCRFNPSTPTNFA